MPDPAPHDYADPSAPPRLCQNCSAPLTGPYCGQCGQHDVDYHRSFHHLTHDLLENVFHFEGKFFVTVAWLLAKPGRITVEFVNGRRASQLNPLRFYIFVSVLFFLGISLLNHGHLVDIPRGSFDAIQRDVTSGVSDTKKLVDEFTLEENIQLGRRIGQASARKHRSLTPEERDALIQEIRVEHKLRASAQPAATAPATTEKPAPAAAATAPGEKPAKPVSTKVRIDQSSGLGQNLARKLGSGELSVSDIWDAIEHRIPTLLFLGVPLFALFLKIFYLGSNRFYVEHLIFSLHLHTWLFLVFMLGNGYLKLASLGPHWLGVVFGWAITLWAIWYFFRSFRVVYGQGRIVTALKISGLWVLHSFALVMLATALISATVAWLAYE